MRVLGGWDRTTMENSSSRGTGKEIAGEWSTIITGTGITTATLTDSMTTTTAIKRAYPVFLLMAVIVGNKSFTGAAFHGRQPQEPISLSIIRWTLT
jgi:hypothetical protein